MSTARQPDITRQRLLECAFDEIHKRGFRSASLDAILDKAGVTKGALYHHFPSKLALFESVFDRLQESATRAIEKRIDTVDDPWERAQIGLEGFLEVCREPQFRRICLQEGPVALGHERWVVAERAASFGIVKRTVDALLDDLGGAGELSEAYAAIFFGAIRSSSEYVADAEDADQAAAEVQASISGILAGMRLLPSLADPPA